MREAQMESARVWNFCKDLHLEVRRVSSRWPNRHDLQTKTKGMFALHSQSIQMVCHAFLNNIEVTRTIRREHPRMRMKYPWRGKRFYPVLWPAQAVCREEGRVVLPMGRGRRSLVLRVDLPENAGACKLVWNGGFELHVSMVLPGEELLPDNGIHGTIDLGQIHQAAAVTNTGKAVVVSGREIRSLKRQKNRLNGRIARLKSKCTKGSRRWRKLSQSAAKTRNRIDRRVRDLRHKGTRKAVEFFKENDVSRIYVGSPHGVRDKDSGRHHNQRMSQWEYGRDISYLQHKSEMERMECLTGTERGTSSRCPECGHLRKVKGRVWRCSRCGFSGHRDVVGGVNMHKIGFDER